VLLWSALNDAMPLYAVYTLLFAGAGLSTARISVLLVVWSASGVILEVPTGALADRFSPRLALVAGGIARAMGYAAWMLAPGFDGFAAGFVLWSLSGALESGSFQAMLYTSLAAQGAADGYARLLGRSQALARIAEVAATLAAAPLLVLGGYALVGWVSVAVSLAGSVVAAGFPRADRTGPDTPAGEEVRYSALLRAGLLEVARTPRLRRLVGLTALVVGLTAVDEYVPLLVRAASVPARWIPVVLAGLPLAAAAGNALAGAASRARVAFVAAPLLAATAALAAAAVAGSPLLLPVLGAWWLLVSLATVLLDARLQDAVRGPARATVASVAALATEVVPIALFVTVAALARPG
jgi:predicted MFS family arabinose efflux permease